MNDPQVIEPTVNTAGLSAHPSRLSAGLPIVKGKCPACGSRSLFLGKGGYITCAILICPNPTAAGDVLEA